MNIKNNYSLLRHNTFGFDVKAKYFAEVFSVDELKQILLSEEFIGVSKLILGGGSNVLFSKDYDGLVIKISIGGISVVKNCVDSVLVKAGAGVEWHQLVLFTLEQDLSGIENLSLIPGTAGAAPIQNIGAYGIEFKDAFFSLQAMDAVTGDIKEFTREECKFGYRSSIFKHELKNKYIILSVTLSLSKQTQINITYGSIKSELEKRGISNPTAKDISRVICDIRTSKLPDTAVFGNAGSFFKNPVIPVEQFAELKAKYPGIAAFKVDENNMKLAAGWLIEQSGWRGKKHGNAAAYENQALVLVNTGGAAPNEVIELAGLIKTSVYEKFGVNIEEEVNII
jgi:UDP-N-acetylmuramate dehydrogenase